MPLLEWFSFLGQSEKFSLIVGSDQIYKGLPLVIFRPHLNFTGQTGFQGLGESPKKDLPEYRSLKIIEISSKTSDERR